MSSLAIFSALIVAPFIEESVFRYSLQKNNIYKFFIYMILTILILTFINLYIGLFLLLAFGYFSLQGFKLKTESDTAFKAFVILSALTFSLCHIPMINGPSSWKSGLIVIVSLFPVGLFFSYIRIESGFKYSIFTHILYNLIILTINEIIY